MRVRSINFWISKIEAEQNNKHNKLSSFPKNIFEEQNEKIAMFVIQRSKSNKPIKLVA